MNSSEKLLPREAKVIAIVFCLLAGVDAVLAVRSLCDLVFDLFMAQASSVNG